MDKKLPILLTCIVALAVLCSAVYTNCSMDAVSRRADDVAKHLGEVQDTIANLNLTYSRLGTEVEGLRSISDSIARGVASVTGKVEAMVGGARDIASGVEVAAGRLSSLADALQGALSDTVGIREAIAGLADANSEFESFLRSVQGSSASTATKP